MTFFYMEATITHWVDADTFDCQPKPYRPRIGLRVRLKDVWAVEIGQPGHDDALASSKLLLGDVGAEVSLAGTRHRWTYERLECRVEPL